MLEQLMYVLNSHHTSLIRDSALDNTHHIISDFAAMVEDGKPRIFGLPTPTYKHVQIIKWVKCADVKMWYLLPPTLRTSHWVPGFRHFLSGVMYGRYAIGIVWYEWRLHLPYNTYHIHAYIFPKWLTLKDLNYGGHAKKFQKQYF